MAQARRLRAAARVSAMHVRPIDGGSPLGHGSSDMSLPLHLRRLRGGGGARCPVRVPRQQGPAAHRDCSVNATCWTRLFRPQSARWPGATCLAVAPCAPTAFRSHFALPLLGSLRASSRFHPGYALPSWEEWRGAEGDMPRRGLGLRPSPSRGSDHAPRATDAQAESTRPSTNVSACTSCATVLGGSNGA